MTTAQRLQATLSDTQNLLSTQWPEMLELVSMSTTSDSANLPNVSARDARDTAEISQEERAELAEKLRMIVSLAPGQLDEQTAAELARQLSFATALPISFVLNGDQLSHHHGSCATIPEQTTPLLPIWPGNTRVERQWYVHVSLADVRASFQNDWQQPWCLHSRVLVIHPTTMQAVAAVVTGILTERTNRYQFGVSKRVAQQTGMWSIGGAGRAVVCLLNASVPAGTTFNLLEPIH